MGSFQLDDRVQVFDPDLQRDVPGTITHTTQGCVLVALDDRMVPVAVDPGNSHAIHLLVVAS